MQNEVIKPTIKGLLDIMKACVKAKSVRRIVFTSSAGTVDVAEKPKPVYDENCWSDVEFCRRVKMTGWVSSLYLCYMFFFLFIYTPPKRMILFHTMFLFVDVFCFKDLGRERSLEICQRA